MAVRAKGVSGCLAINIWIPAMAPSLVALLMKLPGGLYHQNGFTDLPLIHLFSQDPGEVYFPSKVRGCFHPGRHSVRPDRLDPNTLVFILVPGELQDINTMELELRVPHPISAMKKSAPGWEEYNQLSLCLMLMVHQDQEPAIEFSSVAGFTGFYWDLLSHIND